MPLTRGMSGFPQQLSYTFKKFFMPLAQRDPLITLLRPRIFHPPLLALLTITSVLEG